MAVQLETNPAMVVRRRPAGIVHVQSVDAAEIHGQRKAYPRQIHGGARWWREWCRAREKASSTGALATRRRREPASTSIRPFHPRNGSREELSVTSVGQFPLTGPTSHP